VLSSDNGSQEAAMIRLANSMSLPSLLGLLLR
jgi:hypothetical protein